MALENQPVVLAVDPGRSKCGIAVVGQNREVIICRLIETESVLGEILQLFKTYHPEAVALGDGTSCNILLRHLNEELPGVRIEKVDERNTTEQARERYLSQNAPRGWQRLLPRALRTPDRPCDDIAAVILAERYWSSKQSNPNCSTCKTV